MTSKQHANVFIKTATPNTVAMIVSDAKDEPYFFFIDAEAADSIAKHQWYILKCRKKIVYLFRKIAGKTIYLHRWLMDAKPGQMVDHKDRDTLDCRKSNLRITTAAGNSRNKSQGKSSSGFVGVIKAGSRFLARIGVNGKTKHLGCYLTAETAAIARDLHATRLHGEYAVLNYPELGTLMTAITTEFSQEAAS